MGLQLAGMGRAPSGVVPPAPAWFGLTGEERRNRWNSAAGVSAGLLLWVRCTAQTPQVYTALFISAQLAVLRWSPSQT